MVISFYIKVLRFEIPTEPLKQYIFICDVLQMGYHQAAVRLLEWNTITSGSDRRNAEVECLQRAIDGQDGLTPKGTSLAERANTECLCKACRSLSFALSVRATRHSPRSAARQLITTEQPSSPQPRTTTCTKQSPGNGKLTIAMLSPCCTYRKHLILPVQRRQSTRPFDQDSEEICRFLNRQFHFRTIQKKTRSMIEQTIGDF